MLKKNNRNSSTANDLNTNSQQLYLKALSI